MTRLRSRSIDVGGGGSPANGRSTPVALLVFQARAAETGVVSPDPLTRRGEPRAERAAGRSGTSRAAVDRLLAQRLPHRSDPGTRGQSPSGAGPAGDDGPTGGPRSAP